MKKVVFLLFSVILLASCGNETAPAVDASADTTTVVSDSACVDSTAMPVLEKDSTVK